MGYISLIYTRDLEVSTYYFDKQLETSPNDIFALTHRADVYRLQKSFSKAKRDLSRVLGLNSKYVVALICYANIHKQSRSYYQALFFLNRAIAIEPENPVALEYLQQLYKEAPIAVFPEKVSKEMSSSERKALYDQPCKACQNVLGNKICFFTQGSQSRKFNMKIYHHECILNQMQKEKLHSPSQHLTIKRIKGFFCDFPPLGCKGRDLI